MNIKESLSKLPDAPGVYLFYNAAAELIYVGKATALKNRVKSYAAPRAVTRPIEEMIHEVAHVKWQETDSALEAAVVESLYIKKYQPKYNVIGKDDKSWNYITVGTEEYPVVGTIRERELGGLSARELEDRYREVFGPYPGLNARETMKILRRLFLFSTCQKDRRKKVGTACLYYQMGQCLGVCTGEISPQEYRRKVIRPLALFLRGRKRQLVKDIERRMTIASKNEDYEEAGRLRDQLRSLAHIEDVNMLNESFVRDIRLESDFADTARSFRVQRIEGYDISNLGATGMVGSMVVFDESEPVKSEYRKFRIRTVRGQSDVDCLEEVLRRRLNHAADWPLPDIFLIDGGLPQVRRAVKVLNDNRLDIPVVGIAKGPERKRNDFIFGAFSRRLVAYVNIHQDLLIRVRDEAHRFAIGYQRAIRGRAA
ncbi:MAG: Excinuclease ABC, C subunit domain protein [Candidatus Magasanikbacteria bacterium GW2011_GWA2_56_11]|uniref:Excinuclease ABC, C subunit domain protein n=1 Tax=Candidatus Magasanikbacteria bacterium GW2011_GWA2_56_11 TaxID=1619044 RepID=A0A0G1YCV8_9BACT|nr:MAG: Excinuclease ABC, C subunit domain protein [Candidatus Magasanikbacteria bacterium GW2011_GWA2_56_11]